MTTVRRRAARLAVLCCWMVVACEREKAPPPAQTRDPTAREATPVAASIQKAQSGVARGVSPNTRHVRELAADNTAFAFELFRKVAAQVPTENVVLAPFSISTALAMTYEGARGATQAELKKVLHFELGGGTLHEAFNASDRALRARGAGKSGANDTPFRLNMNNALWLQSGFAVEPRYLAVLGENYGSLVQQTDFARDVEAARRAINAAVADQTEQLIDELLPPNSLQSNTRFVLTNTVYFDAAWREKFVVRDTRDAVFTTLAGSPVNVPTMQGDFHIPYAEGADYRAVALPYADDALRFIAVLPAPGKLAQLERELDAEWLSSLDERFSEQSVRVRLPRIESRQHTSLKSRLIELGAPAAFSMAADFSGITREHLQLDDVLHEAVLKVMEGGTIAAGATAVVAVQESAPLVEQAVWFERPFLFAIVDKPTGAVLFLGRVADPRATRR